MAHFDLAHGDVPPWLNNVVALTRPLTTSGIIAIPVMGGFMVGSVASFNYAAALHMADASTKFLQGIPDAGWGAIAAIALGYTASKGLEAVKAGRPQSPSPEAGPNATAPPPDPEPAPARAPAGTEILE